MWLDLLKSFFPIITTLVSTGGLFAFFLKLLSRHDRINANRNLEQQNAELREAVYQLALHKALGYANELLIMVGPAVVAFKDGDKIGAEVLLSYSCDKLCFKDTDGWHIKDPPNFIEMARKEVEILNTRGKPETANTEKSEE